LSAQIPLPKHDPFAQTTWIPFHVNPYLKHSEITHSTESRAIKTEANRRCLYKSLAAGRTDRGEVPARPRVVVPWPTSLPVHDAGLTGESSHAEFSVRAESIQRLATLLLWRKAGRGSGLLGSCLDPAWEEVRHDADGVAEPPSDLFHRSLPAIMLAL
ncbi:hypothetical protein SDJN02_03462, partial [Cucurbita argyrosperma subsp. argyrosperma]